MSWVEAEVLVLVLVRRLRRVLHQRAAALGPGLTPVGYFVLGHLVREGPARQVDLVATSGATSGVEKGAVSRLVAQLEAAGLLERRVDPDDRRACWVAVTGEAEAAFARVDEERRERHHARLEALTTAELQQFADLLGRYIAAVEG